MVGGGPFNLKPGEWTDDTSMALCLAESLVTKTRVRPGPPARNLRPLVARRAPEREGPVLRHRHRNPPARWPASSSTREPFSGRPEPPRGRERIADAARAGAAWRSRTTQPRRSDSRAKVPAPPTPPPNASMRAATSRGLAPRGHQRPAKDELLNNDYEPAATSFAEMPLAEKVASIAGGSFQEKQPPEIRGSGYVIHTLEAALWAFHSTDNFRDGALAVVNLGEDADTTGAVYGQIAGGVLRRRRHSRPSGGRSSRCAI